ncbi:LysR family transcriptional regulator [Vibrio sp. Of7-15]|uniref:LysR family transcriptional regulator n=1 Tax=Vibrio sp. Of7-15 TaxID=2724879 RepID=UPI001EF222FA|nr:LysR family transcriptional regulator [Vibrio sp. Of7-15]MCG7498310.1 LysR family transcriptional regulator [Vibrio sp. Of7-15]
MIDQIDQQWLKSFHCVYEHNSFKKAAEHLNLPTSNVSRHVALLEEKLNTRLLERTTRRIAPTEAGEKLYASTLRLLTALNDAFEDISQHSKEVTGQLKLLMPDVPLLSDIVVSFCVEHPSVSLCCETSLSPKEDLLDGFDVILGYNRGKLADSGWVAKEITRWKSVVVASPSLIQQHDPLFRLVDLNKVPCISSLTALNGAPWVFKGSHGQLIKHNVSSSFKVNSGNMAKSAALAGLGFAILPEEYCLQELQEGTLQSIVLEADPEDLVFYAFYAGRKHLAKKVSAFIEYLQNSLIERG